ncbi:MAG: glycine-rich domain-containing protein [Candidatus Limivicinus sp.]
MIINMSGAGLPGKIVTVCVAPGTGAAVTCSNGSKTYTGITNSSGNALFKLTKGTWTITAELQGVSKTVQASISEDCTVNISLEQIPSFTYTGSYKVVDDDDIEISSTLGNWKIRFLTSGTLTFTSLNGAENGIDVFLVGGGGGGGGYCSGGLDGAGGGGGYTKTSKGVSVNTDASYSISIGAGGAAVGGNTAGISGGETSAFGVIANGGGGGAWYGGGGPSDGGSGGGAGNADGETGGNGGSDGGDGGAGKGSGSKGQGTTTREFGESTGKLYAGGGGGAWYGSGGEGGGAAYGESADANTGGGGGGGYSSGSTSANGGAGGSGIVIIRNKR